MERHSFQTIEDLQLLFESFGDDVLYRGQTKEYGEPSAPILNTSFKRNGCIPPLMLRWSHYARFALTALLHDRDSEVGIEFTQAVLQHYGWRSFYLDLTDEPAVACWFAAHSFSMKKGIEMAQDCYDDGVFLVKNNAAYSQEEGQGHLYVISKSALLSAGIGCHDLSAIDIANCRPRFHAQRAWLAGALSSDLPITCISASLSGPRSVLAEFAVERGYKATSDLFPGRIEDPVLDVLMSLPWTKIRIPKDDKPGMEFYQQVLEFPEYEDSFRKRQPPYVAMYKGERAADLAKDSGITFVQVPEEMLFGSAQDLPPIFPTLARLVSEKGCVVFEVPSLIRMPERLRSHEYLKGVALEKRGSLIAVADFVVDHPGMQMVGVAINFPWHYSVDADGRWCRQTTKDDCPCEIAWRHKHHLSVLAMIENWYVSRRQKLRGFAQV